MVMFMIASNVAAFDHSAASALRVDKIRSLPLEQMALSPRRAEGVAEMLVGDFRRDAAAWRTRQNVGLNQIRQVYIFDRDGTLRSGCVQSVYAGGSACE